MRGVVKESSEKVFLQQLKIDLEIKSAYISESDETVYIALNRGVGEGELSALIFIFEGSSYIYRYPLTPGIPKELGSKVYNITADGVRAQNLDFTDFSSIKSISLSFEITSSGKTLTNPVKSKFDKELRLDNNLLNQWDGSSAPVYEGSGYEGSCSGTETNCGIFPNCNNCNFQDGCSGNSYRNYYCSGANCLFSLDDCTDDCSCVCGGYGRTSEIGYCLDGIDNDCGGGVDCADSDCSSEPACLGAITIQFDNFETNFTQPWYDDGIIEKWTRGSDGTSTTSTGPCGGASNCPENAGAPNDVGVNTTWYIYVETSFAECYTAGETAITSQTPSINFNTYTGEKIRWWNNMYGSNIGTLSLQENTTGSWVELWSMSGNQGTAWFQSVVDLSGLTGTGNLKFYYTCAGSLYGDIAIDEIWIYRF